MRDIRETADSVKRRVSCLEEGKRMGLDPDRSGFCRCPFHSEKTASMKLYTADGGYHCYGCGASGDVIGLVMRYWGISFRQALIRLDSEWGLGLHLVEHPMNAQEKREAEHRRWLEAMKRQDEQDWRRSVLEAYWDACDIAYGFIRQIRDNAPTGPQRDWNEAFCDGLRHITEAEDTMKRLAVLAIGGGGG